MVNDDIRFQLNGTGHVNKKKKRKENVYIIFFQSLFCHEWLETRFIIISGMHTAIKKSSFQWIDGKVATSVILCYQTLKLTFKTLMNDVLLSARIALSWRQKKRTYWAKQLNLGSKTVFNLNLFSKTYLSDFSSDHSTWVHRPH